MSPSQYAEHPRESPSGLQERRARVVWDMTFAEQTLTGTRVYARELTTALRALHTFEIVQVAADTGGEPLKKNRTRGVTRVWWLAHGLARALSRARADLVHVAAYLGPRRAPCPSIVNVFDTTFLAYPRDFDWKWRAYVRVFLAASVQRAAAFLTLSEHARREIARAFNVPREKIHVVYPGVGGILRACPDPNLVAATRTKFGLPENYLVFVGAQEPRKNIPALIEALALARVTFPTLILALVGPRGRGSAAIQNAIRKEGMTHAVCDLGFVADAELPALYAGARAFVFASKLEGFGMPPVEAMACGAPVIAAPNPPLPEVLGDAAWFTADDSPDAMAEAIVRVLCDDALARLLRARGAERAREYTWARAAQATAQLYEDVLRGTLQGGVK